MKKQIKGSQKPFFATFLEAQDNLSGEEQQSVQGGTDAQTQKYPSDQEDGPGIPTRPAKDVAETLKYPSDGDEAQTMKYPSDNDDVGPIA